MQLICGKRGKAKQESGRIISTGEPASPDGRRLWAKVSGSRNLQEERVRKKGEQARWNGDQGKEREKRKEGERRGGKKPREGEREREKARAGEPLFPHWPSADANLLVRICKWYSLRYG